MAGVAVSDREAMKALVKAFKHAPTLKALKPLLSEEAASFADKDGRFALHHAASESGVNVDVIKAVHRLHPQALSTPDELGLYPLHLAASRDVPDEQVVKALVAADPRSTMAVAPPKRSLPIHFALRVPTVSQEVVLTLLAASKQSAGVADEDGIYPLHLALYARPLPVPIVQPLMTASRAAISAVDPDGRTPLHLAAIVGDVDIAGQLLMLHPDARLAQDNAGNYPVDLLHTSSMGYGALNLLLQVRPGETVAQQSQPSQLSKPSLHQTPSTSADGLSSRGLRHRDAPPPPARAPPKTPSTGEAAAGTVGPPPPAPVGPSPAQFVGSAGGDADKGVTRLDWLTGKFSKLFNKPDGDRASPPPPHALKAPDASGAHSPMSFFPDDPRAAPVTPGARRRRTSVSRAATGLLSLLSGPVGTPVPDNEVSRLVVLNPADAKRAHVGNATPLHLACQRIVSVRDLQALVAAYPAALMKPDKHGRLPLHYCAGRSPPHLATLKFLMGSAPDAVNVKDEDAALPLHHACRAKGTTAEFIAELLTAAPDSVTVPDSSGGVALHLACDADEPSPDVIATLLQADFSAAGVVDEHDRFAVHLLASAGATVPDAVHCALLNANSEAAFAPDVEGMTVLHHAVTATQPSPTYVSELLARNPQAASAADSRGWTPLHLAAWYFAKQSPTQPAPLKDWNAVIDRLLRIHPVSAKAVDHHQRLPVHLAACGSEVCLRMMCKLTSSHFGLDAQDQAGQLPIHVACATSPSVAVVKFLLSATPPASESTASMLDVALRRATTADINGRVCLHVALLAPMPSLDIISLLVALEPCRGLVDKSGRTPTDYLTPAHRDAVQQVVKGTASGELIVQQLYPPLAPSTWFEEVLVSPLSRVPSRPAVLPSGGGGVPSLADTSLDDAIGATRVDTATPSVDIPDMGTEPTMVPESSGDYEAATALTSPSRPASVRQWLAVNSRVPHTLTPPLAATTGGGAQMEAALVDEVVELTERLRVLEGVVLAQQHRIDELAQAAAPPPPPKSCCSVS